MRTAIVIGSNADALVAAQLLARAGCAVTVIDEHPAGLSEAGWVPPELAAALGLTAVKTELPDPWLRTFLPDGSALELWQDVRRSAEALRRISPHDAENWPRFAERMQRLAGFLQRLYLAPPPSMVDLRFALKLRGLGRQAMEDLMRLLPMPAAELLDEWFDAEILKGALGALAVRDLQQGPRSAGTAFALLHSHVGLAAGVFRAPSSNLCALLRAARGLAVREGRVANIRVRAGRASGITMHDGEELPADLVVSAIDARRALDELIEPGWLDPDLVMGVRRLRRRGVRAMVRWRLDDAPDWRTHTFAPSLDYVEQAYDDAKYGRVSAKPWIDARVADRTVTAHFQYAPYELRLGAWDEQRRADIAAAALKLLPPLGGIREMQAFAPPDLERTAGWPQGQPLHAELALDQALWMRPVPELARYRTPIEGLWLCGPAMHPGVPGIAGYNCAQEILRA